MKPQQQTIRPLSIVYHVEHGAHRWPIDYVPVSIVDTGDLNKAFELMQNPDHPDFRLNVIRVKDSRCSDEGDVVMTVFDTIEVHRKDPQGWTLIESVPATIALAPIVS